jgi:hypothetical protein
VATTDIAVVSGYSFPSQVIAIVSLDDGAIEMALGFDQPACRFNTRHASSACA